MSARASTFTFLIYMAFATLFHVQHNWKAAGILLFIFGLLSLVAKPLKKGLPLLLVIILVYALIVASRYIPYFAWPIDLFIITALGFVFSKYILKVKVPKLNWSFRFQRKQWLSIAIINVPAVFILLWYFSCHQEVADKWPLPTMPIWALPFVILLIAAINGLREEILYRGLLEPLSILVAPRWFVIALQALLFGFLHFANAFPQGWIGVAMTAAWGAAIAIQYYIFRSISLAWVTHAIADAVMFAAIVFYKS